MPHPITQDDVRQVARLSRLRLSEAQVAHFTDQLAAVLEYVGKLDELDLAGVEPLAHASDQASVMRDDVERPGLPPDVLLGSAPDRQDDFFKVPRVLGEGAGA